MNKVTISGIKEELFIERLDNGLDIYMLPNNNVKNFYITLNTKYGSIDTEYKMDGKHIKTSNGVAHYLEHLKFNMDGESVFDYYSKIGSNVNAFTTYDMTGYEVLSNSKFKENLEYLIKFVYTPYFTKKLFDDEKGIILEEVKMYQDNPDSVLAYAILNNLFIKDKRANIVSGTVDDVKNITLEDIKNSYDSFYNPSNMFMVITGAFDPSEAVAIVTEEMSKLEFSKVDSEKKLIVEPFKVKEDKVLNMDVDKPKVALGIKIPKNNFKSLKLSKVMQKLYLNLILTINYGETSQLKEELITSNIISDDYSRMTLETDEYYSVIFFASTDYPEYFTKKIKDTFNNLKITKEDINRKIKSAISSFIISFDDIELTNGNITEDILAYGNYLNDYKSTLLSLNYDEALKYLEKLQKNLFTIVKINPLEEDNK